MANGATPNAAVIPVAPSIPAPEPIISEELMGRLITRALASKKPYAIDTESCAIFALCAPGQDLPARQVSEPVPEDKHLFTASLKEGTKDVLVTFKSKDATEMYLTDKTGVLRAAAVWSRAGRLSMITNEQAAEKFKIELRLFAKLALQTPPDRNRRRRQQLADYQ